MQHIADSRWRVLPVGRAATLLRTAREAVLYGLIGLAGLLGVAVLSGLVAEELFAETAGATTLDLVARASTVGVLGLGLLGLFLLGLLGALEGPLMARALAAAGRRGTPATDVPEPAQWAAARESSAPAYRGVALPLLAILGLPYVIMLFVVLGDPDPVGLAILGGGAVLLAAIWAGIPLTGRVLSRRQSGFADELPQRWTQAHRIIAAGRELTAEDVVAERAEAGLTDTLPGRGVRRLGTVLLAVVVVSAMAGTTAFQMIVAVAYPDATRTAGRQLGERADLAPEGERLVDLLAAGIGICGTVGTLAFAGMVACTILLRRLEHRELRRHLADPSGPPPPYALLGRAMARTALPLLQLVFAVSGAAAALGIALWFVDLVKDHPDWDFYAAAGPQLRAAALLGPWVVLGALGAMGLAIVLGSVLDARDRGLRDQLVQRWPVRAAETTTPDATAG
jgi:hypothetical protein